VRKLLLVTLVVACNACLFGPDEEAIATSDEFVGRIADHMTECGFDGDDLVDKLEDDGLDCDAAVSVEGDPLACAADFEDVDCEDLSEDSVNETIGDCDGEILVRKTDD
jgi:hypothetical protein